MSDQPNTPSDADDALFDFPEQPAAPTGQGDAARNSRLSADASAAASSAAYEDDGGAAVVDEYERRYYGGGTAAADAPEKRKNGPRRIDFHEITEKSKRAGAPLSYSTLNLSKDERLWAAIAHGSIWLTLVLGLVSGGMLVPITIFVPLVIYFAWRNQSDFVAYHALQAFALQLLATVGVLALTIVGGILWGIGLALAALSIVILIGIVLLPVWLVAGVVFFVVCAALPFAAGVFGAMAAVEVYNGHDYQYPYLSRWIDRQMAGSYIRAA